MRKVKRGKLENQMKRKGVNVIDFDIKELVEKIKKNYKELEEPFNLIPLEEDEFPYEVVIENMLDEILSTDAKVTNIVKDSIIVPDYLLLESLKDLEKPIFTNGKLANKEPLLLHSVTYINRSMELILATILVKELYNREELLNFFIDVISSIEEKLITQEELIEVVYKYCRLVTQLDQGLLKEVSNKIHQLTA